MLYFPHQKHILQEAMRQETILPASRQRLYQWRRFVKGLELSRQFYEEYGVPLLRDRFADCASLVAAGLTGSGSECYGYDDELSRDHDFEPGFCLFLPEEDQLDRRTAFLLERAYAALPDAYAGFRRAKLAPTGGSRHGVFRLRAWFEEKIGGWPEELTADQWLRLPSSALAEAVNGAVFQDDAGVWTRARAILAAMPEDVRKKRLAGHLLMMAQSGQYNYLRCLGHGEPGAAQLSAGLFVHHAMEAMFLLHKRYLPFYKWAFRALRELPGGEDAARTFEWLLSSGNEPPLAQDKAYAMEGVAAEVIDLLRTQGLTDATCQDLEKHAYSVNDKIREESIRNLHILYAV